MRNRNIDILEHIRDYCIDIGNTMQRFGNEKSVFETDMDYRNSVCMSLLQIGELTGHLTEEFRDSTKERMYWPAIKGMRNLFAHNYGAVDIDKVWDTAISDIPQLFAFCEENIQRYRVMMQEEVVPEWEDDWEEDQER